MLFNSLDFLLFFAVVFLLYWIIPSTKKSAKNSILLVASYFFYGYWDWRFLGLIVLSTATDFFIGLALAKQNNQSTKKLLLWVSLALNLGILAYFKYANFFVTELATLFSHAGLQTPIYTLNIILPVGISFYTFQTLSYTIDVYRGQLKPTTNLLSFAVFVAFFPQLVAGPIERASRLLPQFNVPHTFNYNMAKSGAFLMLYGFFKKTVVADNLARYVDPVFANPIGFESWEVARAIFAFTIQLYTDFSGYSDIAIGLAAIFGFRLSTNFRTPLFSSSIRQFWQRWHISLSTWFRDYVFIPIGGSRGSALRNVAVVAVTFLLSGLWHGAAWTFVIWGALHALFYVLEKQLPWKPPSWLARIITFILIVLAFVFFRAPNTNQAWLIITSLFASPVFAPVTLERIDIVMLASLLLFFIVEARISKKENFAVWLSTWNKPVALIAIYLLLFWTIAFGAFSTGQNFIYFTF